MYIVMNERNVAEIGEEVEGDGWQEGDPVGFTVQGSGPEGGAYRDIIGVQVNPDGSLTVGHWPDGEVWVEMGTAYHPDVDPDSQAERNHRRARGQEGWV